MDNQIKIEGYQCNLGSLYTGEQQSGKGYFSQEFQPIKEKSIIESTPYRFIGLLKINFAQSQYKLGTGFLISNNHVLTACHNIYNDGKFAKPENVEFYPLTLDSKQTNKQQMLAITKIYYNETYAKLKYPFNLVYDYAVLQLKDNIGSKLGYFGLVSPNLIYLQNYDFFIQKQQQNENNQIQVCGYPANEKNMYRSSHFLMKYTNELLYYLIPTQSGQSGGPILIYDNQYGWVAIGIHVYGELRYKIGNRITIDKYNQILQWMNGNNIQIVLKSQYFLENKNSILKTNIKPQQDSEKHQKGIHSIQALSQNIIATGEYQAFTNKAYIPYVKIWNIRTNSLLNSIKLSGSCRKFIVDGYLLMYTDESKIILFDWYQNIQLTYKMKGFVKQKIGEEEKLIFQDDIQNFKANIYSIAQISSLAYYLGDANGNLYMIGLDDKLLQPQEQQSKYTHDFIITYEEISNDNDKHQDGLYSIVTFEKTQAFTAGKDKIIKLWDNSSVNRIMGKWNSNHQDSIYDMKILNNFQDNKQALLTGSTDKTIKIFFINYNEDQLSQVQLVEIKNINIFKNKIFSFILLNDREVAVSDNSDLVIFNVYDPKQNNHRIPIAHKEKYKFNLTSEPFTNSLITGGDDNEIYIWESK